VTAELFHAEERAVPRGHALLIDTVTDVSEKLSAYIFRVNQFKNSTTTILGMLNLRMRTVRAPDTSLFTSTDGVTPRKNVPSSVPT
jgi:hypothetical protein